MLTNLSVPIRFARRADANDRRFADIDFYQGIIPPRNRRSRTCVCRPGPFLDTIKAQTHTAIVLEREHVLPTLDPIVACPRPTLSQPAPTRPASRYRTCCRPGLPQHRLRCQATCLRCIRRSRCSKRGVCCCSSALRAGRVPLCVRWCVVQRSQTVEQPFQPCSLTLQPSKRLARAMWHSAINLASFLPSQIQPVVPASRSPWSCALGFGRAPLATFC